MASKTMPESRALRIFYDTIGSPATKKQYDYQLKLFQKHYRLRTVESMLTIDPKELQTMIEDYVYEIKQKGLSKSYVNMAVCAIQGFTSMNDVVLNFPKIKRLYRNQEQKKQQDRPYTTHEIQTILETTTSKRNKAIIHFLAASGVRIGALIGLKLKHLAETTQNCKSILVYAGTKDEYTTFLTPEASKILDDYFNDRRDIGGESLNPESPVFREKYTVKGQKPIPVTESILTGMIKHVLSKANLKTEKINGRYSMMRFHGFRKRFDTILKNNKEINPNIIEKLMGHKRGLDGSYFKPTKDELFAEYQKGMADLMINDSERVLAEKKKIEIDRTEIEIMKQKLELQQKQMTILEHKIDLVTTTSKVKDSSKNQTPTN